MTDSEFFSKLAGFAKKAMKSAGPMMGAMAGPALGAALYGGNPLQAAMGGLMNQMGVNPMYPMMGGHPMGPMGGHPMAPMGSINPMTGAPYPPAGGCCPPCPRHHHHHPYHPPHPYHGGGYYSQTDSAVESEEGEECELCECDEAVESQY